MGHLCLLALEAREQVCGVGKGGLQPTLAEAGSLLDLVFLRYPGEKV